jgi:hypothetical protein
MRSKSLMHTMLPFTSKERFIFRIPQPRRKIKFTNVRIYQGARAIMKNRPLQRKHTEELVKLFIFRENTESSSESSVGDTSSTEGLTSVEEEKSKPSL